MDIAVSRTASSCDRLAPVVSNAPLLMRDSIALLLTFLRSTRLQKSNIELYLPLSCLFVITDSIADSPIFFMATHPNLIALPETVKSIALSLTSGGSIEIPISLHSRIPAVILSILPISHVNMAAIYSTG